MKTVFKQIGCLAVFILLWVPLAHGQGEIIGTTQMELENGEVAHAGRVRVLLTTTPVAIPSLPELSSMNTYQKMESIRTLHMDFFINVRQQMAQLDYLFDSTLTDPDGIFRFTALPPWTYYIVVAFPAMIESYKVAWQVPVEIKQDEVVKMVLNRANMAVPTYTRNRN